MKFIKIKDSYGDLHYLNLENVIDIRTWNIEEDNGKTWYKIEYITNYTSKNFYNVYENFENENERNTRLKVILKELEE